MLYAFALFHLLGPGAVDKDDLAMCMQLALWQSLPPTSCATARPSRNIADVLHKGFGAICEIKDLFAGNLQALISGGGGSGSQAQEAVHYRGELMPASPAGGLHLFWLLYKSIYA